MEIAILGGTGDLGCGLARRWVRDAEHRVVIGSRSADRAADAARQCADALAGTADEPSGAIEGRANAAAAADADVVIAAVPAEHLASAIESVADELADDAVLVSPAIGFAVDDAGAHYRPPDAGSYAAVAAAAAPEDVPVVGAFHTVSHRTLGDLEHDLDHDVPVVGDDPEARRTVAGLAADVDGLRGIHAGPLANASEVERLGPLLITLGRFNDGSHYGLGFR